MNEPSARRGLVRSWIGEAACGVALAVLGGVFMLGGRRMGLFEDGAPGPGLVPMLIGAVLVGLGAAIAAMSIARRTDAYVLLFDRDSMAAAGLMLAAIVLFEPAGYVPSAFLFLWASFTLIGREPPGRAAVVAALATVASWGLFVKALGVPLPRGALSWL